MEEEEEEEIVIPEGEDQREHLNLVFIGHVGTPLGSPALPLSLPQPLTPPMWPACHCVTLSVADKASLHWPAVMCCALRCRQVNDRRADPVFGGYGGQENH